MEEPVPLRPALHVPSADMNQKAVEEAARILYEARVGHYQIDALPWDCTPRTIDDAYAVQQRLLELLDADEAGWLLGFTNSPSRLLASSRTTEQMARSSAAPAPRTGERSIASSSRSCCG
jgi:hypothetical protein